VEKVCAIRQSYGIEIMTVRDAPEGQLFSRTYLERGIPSRDSKRFRTRLAAYFHQKLAETLYDLLHKAIERELGVDVPSTHGIADYSTYFSKVEVRDVLDTISLIARLLRDRGDNSVAEAFISFVQRSFEEENLGYRVDAKGGVHYFIDEEFERNRVSAIASTTSPKYAAVAKALESAFSALDAREINTKTAVRDAFEALETLTKLLTNSNTNLDEKLVKKALGDLLRKLPEHGEPSGASTISKFIESLADWVNAAHPYRHGQKTEKLVAPSLSSAVLFLSTGAAYIRWLVDQLGNANERQKNNQ
jgi:hypothetical protein